MFSQGKLRRTLCLLFVPLIVVTTLFTIQRISTGKVSVPKLEELDPRPAKSTDPPKVIHKPPLAQPPPIVDSFPLATRANSSADLPPIPIWNTPPSPHVNESTPLFIGFTRNWGLLQQVVVSYITAGWPPEDIYVIENTGVMKSNRDGLLTLQNPFYLDYRRLTKVFGVNVIQTPTLLTFAQMQNFFTFTAVEHDWPHYFWAHMDTVAVSDEEWDGDPWKPLYVRAVDALRETLDPAWGTLATRWFAYDTLALVRTQTFVDVGGWDTMIPFYLTDCDMHERLWMRKFRIENAAAGKIWDVARSMDNLELLYKRGGDSVSLGKREDAATLPSSAAAPNPSAVAESPAKWSGIQRSSVMYHEVLRELDTMQLEKNAKGGGERNTWQARQAGGQGEPFYRDPEGFEESILSLMEWGRTTYRAKWGRGDCNLRDVGMVEEDAWRVIPGWENPGVQKKHRKEKAKQEKEKISQERKEVEAKDKEVKEKEKSKAAV